ncbi:MAG: hypothetical protein ACLQUZ_09490 [Rhizomicrobium sp.]
MTVDGYDFDGRVAIVTGGGIKGEDSLACMEVLDAIRESAANDGALVTLNKS